MCTSVNKNRGICLFALRLQCCVFLMNAHHAMCKLASFGCDFGWKFPTKCKDKPKRGMHRPQKIRSVSDATMAINVKPASPQAPRFAGAGRRHEFSPIHMYIDIRKRLFLQEIRGNTYIPLVRSIQIHAHDRG